MTIATLGFVGTGAITHAMVSGLCKAREAPETIWVSPRNHQISSGLGAAFSNVRVGISNQDVLDCADTIVLAVRPQIARTVIESLVFRNERFGAIVPYWTINHGPTISMYYREWRRHHFSVKQRNSAGTNDLRPAARQSTSPTMDYAAQTLCP
jgi:hypothetical protein